jgi:YbgC/YbaW family acyl-CoA thioester hydrolase
MAFRITRRVEFGDTDMAGIMHFANFFRFMEVAETEFLRSRGLSVTWREGAQRLGFPRVSASCDYLKPARFEDLLDVAVTIEKIGTKSVTYRFDFSCSGEAIAVGRISTVYCRATKDNQLESAEIPAEIRAKLEE